MVTEGFAISTTDPLENKVPVILRSKSKRVQVTNLTCDHSGEDECGAKLAIKDDEACDPLEGGRFVAS
ncbi:hypothetical protein L1987_16465 [Smallanthus sonchifolius]|uniref:Uncharacterized protein n=1 Tax=Smallanthus sonchifolius TaxID=185202 RepID=A0ACB9JAK0_9ASTR|nr:hypothetical protein L1987_16465 [Smallanthus sonchifolius]